MRAKADPRQVAYRDRTKPRTIGKAQGMLAFSFAVLLAASAPATGDTRLCQDEQQPIGSGLPFLTAEERARDLNAVTSVAKVLDVSSVRSQAVAVGFVVRIAHGDTYYESRPGPWLTSTQRSAVAEVLLTPGVTMTPGNPRPDVAKQLREAIGSPVRFYLPIHFQPPVFQRYGMRVVHCTPRYKR